MLIVSRRAMPRWLAHFGVPGLFTVAMLDSSVIPLPIPGTTDLLLLWLVAHGSSAWLLVPITIAGSMLGGYTTWQLGKKGGEATLHHFVRASLLKRVSTWMEHHPIFAVFLPAVLPPPIPLSPFILASGALRVSLKRFLSVFAVARSARYSLVGWLGAVYGPRVVRLWSATLDRWAAPVSWVILGLTICTIVLGIFKLRRLNKEKGKGKPDTTRVSGLPGGSRGLRPDS